MGPNDHHRFLSLFFPSDPIERLGKSMLIYGGPGTGKSRLAAVFAHLLAVVYRCPALYFAVSDPGTSTTEVCIQTVEAWQLPYEKPTPVYYAADKASRTGSQIRICGISTTWAELDQELWETARAFSEAKIVVVDSIGLLGKASRIDLGDIIRQFSHERILLLVGEETEEPGSLAALEDIQALVNILVRLGFNLPPKGENGPIFRYCEFSKLAHSGMLGRHSLQIREGRIRVYPACEFWDHPERFV